MPGPTSSFVSGFLTIAGGYKATLIASRFTTAAAVMTLDSTYRGQLTVTGGPTSYVFKIGRFRKLLSFKQWNSQGADGAKTQKPVRSVTPNAAAGTVTVVWDTTIANSVGDVEFVVQSV